METRAIDCKEWPPRAQALRRRSRGHRGRGPTAGRGGPSSFRGDARGGSRSRRDGARTRRDFRRDVPSAGQLQGHRPQPAEKATLLVPDAFSNPEYVRFAVRGGLACLICTILFVGFDYPGVYTSVITLLRGVALDGGASTQKGFLRFGGSAAGARWGSSP